MRPTQHPTSNDVLRAPPGVSHEDCAPLFITRVRYALPDGEAMPGVVSYWQPSAEQLALLNEGKPVWLSCWGMTHPPVALGVDGDGRLL